MRGKLILALLIGMASAAGWWWLTVRSERGELITVERGDVDEILRVPGWVEPVGGVVEVSTTASGVVTSLPVAVGEPVAVGQVVATLDQEEVAARVAQARAAVKQAEARAAALRAVLKQVEAEAAAERSRKEAAREGSGTPGSSPAANPGAPEATRESPEVTVHGQREAVAAAEAAVALARAQLAEAEAQLGRTVVHAPVAGTLIRRDVEVGELVGGIQPAPIVAIADLSRLQVRLELDESDLGRVRPGMAGYVTSAATGKLKVPGTIEQMGFELGRRKVPVDDPRARTDTRVLEVIMSLEEPGPLKLKQRVEASIILSTAKDVLLVPVKGIFHEEGRPYVKVPGAVGIEQHPVVLGVSDGQRVEIREGVREGQRLTIDPAVR